jgi:Na+-driven multidrug efflux pump
MEIDKHYLSNASNTNLFKRYAIPSLIGFLFFGVQVIIDGITVGNFVGADALSAINIVLPFYNLFVVIGVVVGIGSQTVVSINLGAGKKENAQNAMTSGIIALAFIGVLFTLTIFFFSEQISVFLGADGVLLPYALDYFKGICFFIIPIFGMFFSDSMLKATGTPIFSMKVMSFVIILNIILNLFFVIALELGNFGVSLGTGIALTAGFLISGTKLTAGKNELRLFAGRFDYKLFRNAIYNGSSEGVAELSSALSIMLINITMMKMAGPSGVAAFTVLNYLYFVGILVFLGISDGLIPVIGYNFGAKNYSRIKNLLYFLMKVNFSLGIIIFAVLTLFGDFVSRLFLDTPTKEITDLLSSGTAVYAFAFLMNGLTILFSSFYTAIGDAKRSIVIALSRGIVFIYIGVFILPNFFGTTGVWLSIPIAEFMTLFVIFFMFGKTRKKLFSYSAV